MKNYYQEECNDFEDLFKCNNYCLKGVSNNDKEICKRLGNLNISSIENLHFKYNKIIPLFLGSIKDLGKDTKEYYDNKLMNIKINRSRVFDNGSAEVIGNSKIQTVYLTRKAFKTTDFIAFSHELGHLPSFEIGAKNEYFEYSEILSIFFEYLSWLKLNKENAKELFIKLRLSIAKEESNYYILEDNENVYLDKYHHDYLEYSKRNHIKYIYSLEYVLNMIDIYDSDKKTINYLIDSIINSNSTFKDEEEKLGINTVLFKKLIKASNMYK